MAERDKLGRFMKGYISEKKDKKLEEIYGKERAEKIKKDISNVNKGKHYSPETEFKRGKISLRKDKSYEEIYGEEKAKGLKRKLGISHRGIKLSKETIEKIREKHKGKNRKPFTMKWKEKISESIKKGYNEGKWKPPSYIDGRSKLLAPARYGDDWDKIRYLVYLRDGFSCQGCGVKGTRLDIHHKIPFLISRDNSLGNLITLCRKCHMKEESKRKNLIKQEVLLYGRYN